MSDSTAWMEMDGGFIPLVVEATGYAEVTLSLAFPELEEEPDE